MRIFLWAMAFVVAPFSIRAMETEPVPPPMVAGFADGNGQIGIFAGAEGGVDGVNLATGKMIWTSREGMAPVHSTFGWVAVVATAPGPALRVRFLRPGDGKPFGKAAMVRLPSWSMAGKDVQADENGVSFYANGVTLSLEAWSPKPSRNPDREPRAGWLRMKWRAKFAPVGGARPPSEYFRLDSGLVFVEPATGAVETAPPETRDFPQPVNPELFPNWKPEKDHRYYSWTKYGSVWSDKPRVFRIGGAVSAYLAYQETGKRLIMNRWRPGEPLAPVEISRGKDQAIFVSLNGNHLVLVEGNAGEETFQLVDLLRGGGNPQTLPRLESGYRSSVLVLGKMFFYRTESRNDRSDMKTIIERRLVAMDLKKNRKAWAYSLAPRIEYGPYPGARGAGEE